MYKDVDEYDPLLDEAEALELGKCKEVLGEEYYMPCHKSRGWVRCFMTLTHTSGYRYSIRFLDV
jgi:hypothetical protein